MNAVAETFRKSKDRGAFHDLYDILSGKLYYLCLRYLKNEPDAQDILQEIFVTIYHKIDSFTGNGSFEGWAKRIAINHCLQKLKADQKHFIFNHSIGEQDIFLEEESNFLEQEETEEDLLKALHELPAGYRTILNLAILEDYSHKEIGLLLNITESTSRSQLARAKVALREKLNSR